MSESDIDRLTKLQQSEASLHWKRNGFFLLSSSILLVAVSQFESFFLMIAFGILGIVMNIVWLGIQYRSSEYIKQWKTKVTELEKKLESTADTYSEKVKGIEMRKLALVLPFPFLMIWVAVVIQACLCIHFNQTDCLF